jgi:hypothetical protein
MHGDHTSQSERDWVYAKRALAGGLAPEEVMSDIAEFRAHDKWDPADCARRTDTEALAELKSSSSPQIPGPEAGEETGQDRGH